MAFWSRRNSRQVYVYTYRDGKQQVLPRELTRHLDSEPDHNVESWVSQYEQQYGSSPQQVTTLPTDLATRRLLRRVSEYCEYLRTSRRKSVSTVRSHRLALEQWVVPYYVIECSGVTDPNQWPARSAQLYEYLVSREVSIHNILRVNIALRGFWRWLGEERYLTTPYQLRLRTPPGHRSTRRTPLRVALSPEDILDYVRGIPADYQYRRELQLLALLGYGFSLRSQETPALRRMDFRAGGSLASELECCRVAAGLRLYSRLAVQVTQQRRHSGELVPPKSHSVGWVACPWRELSTMIIGIVNQYRSSELLFPLLPDWYMRQWREHGIPGVTLKDLRRASLLYLGSHTPMQLVHLQAHARHSDPATTSLYLRRPEEEIPATDELLDLDA